MSETKMMRPPMEVQYREELEALAANDAARKPIGWKLSPQAVRTFILGSKKPLPYNGKEITIKKKYYGNDTLIERCIDHEHGDRAVTHFRRISPSDAAGTGTPPEAGLRADASGFSVLQLKLETGRTHQIRVHMAAVGHPLLGDSLYNPSVIPLFEKGRPLPGAELPYGLARQALHSWKLDLTHPITKEPMHFTAPVPDDMAVLLNMSG